jgi:hypothetical protein
MNRSGNLNTLRDAINSGKFPIDFPHFGGANLIITDDEKRHYHEMDRVIYTAHASALSWLVIELKKIFDSNLNYQNKNDFYPYIGILIQSSLKHNDDLFETMLFVVEKIEEDWGAEQ